MIEIHVLNGGTMFINYMHILSIENIPETKVLLTNGRHYLVQETVEVIQERIVAFMSRALTYADRKDG